MILVSDIDHSANEIYFHRLHRLRETGEQVYISLSLSVEEFTFETPCMHEQKPNGDGYILFKLNI
jgi:hypothetical protein